MILMMDVYSRTQRLLLPKRSLVIKIGKVVIMNEIRMVFTFLMVVRYTLINLWRIEVNLSTRANSVMVASVPLVRITM